MIYLFFCFCQKQLMKNFKNFLSSSIKEIPWQIIIFFIITDADWQTVIYSSTEKINFKISHCVKL